MDPLIVSTDFSRPSVNAANYAADMAVYLNTKLCLVHVIQIPATSFQVPITELEFNEIQRNAEISLEKLQMELIYRTKNKIEVTKEIRYGAVEQELEKLGNEKKPLAIVLGKKIGSPWQRFLMGSNTLRAIHHISYPVLIIPENIVFKPLKCTTIASDLKQTSENTAILLIKKILNAFHASVKIIHANTSHETESVKNAGALSLQKYFSDLLPKIFYISKENIQEGINEFLNTQKTDLLIIMPEKHGFLGSLFQSSDSNKIILHSNIPILSVMTTPSSSEEPKNLKDLMTNATDISLRDR